MRTPNSPTIAAARRLGTRSPVLATVLLAGLIALLAGCGGNGITSAAKTFAVGPPDDEGLRRTIIVDPGYHSPSMVEKRVESVVADSAAAGHRIRIAIVGSGNSSAWTPVDLANDGDLRREARNSHGRSEEQSANVEAVMADVRTALARFSNDGTGADLFGALARAVADPVGAAQVVLITGGGVHQSSELDIIAGYGEVADLLPWIPAVVGTETDVFILGAADFSGVSEAPPIDFTDAVATLWQEACRQWELRSCQLADDADVLTREEA